MDNIITLKNICMAYGNTQILFNINMDVKEREFITILGPSGCGKTTILRIIGGFEKPTSGQVLFGDKVINDIPPYKRHINTIFQRYSLFPHMNIYENIAFGLRIKKLPEKEITDKVKRMLKLVNLEGFEERNVYSLSGGQQQRVAIARALVNEPKVLLLDEPLSALDSYLRKEMQLELKSMQLKTGITFIYVTHDQEEALTMSDTVMVMNKGVIHQVGNPVDIYNEPKDIFTAKFIGESNIIGGIMPEDYLVRFAGHDFKCVDKGFEKNQKVNVVIRPEDLIVSDPDDGILQGIITSVVFKGVHYEMFARENERTWMIHSTVFHPVGTEVGLSVDPGNIHVMKGEHEDR